MSRQNSPWTEIHDTMPRRVRKTDKAGQRGKGSREGLSKVMAFAMNCTMPGGKVFQVTAMQRPRGPSLLNVIKM